ncbi:MAG TPA: hypothetical protein VKA46_40525 [Gemmataceae bacterium]|nr:hypothetical protein [Gemmataceae bacterium]
MIHRDPRCVFVADSPTLAEVVVVWLDEQGIPARVMNPATLGGLLDLTPWSLTGVSSTGIEVWVDDPAQAPQALERLAEQEQFRAEKSAVPTEGDATVEAICEECGEANTFPASQRGTTQNCCHCGGYIDVPGEEGEWDEPEQPAEEEDGD